MIPVTYGTAPGRLTIYLGPTPILVARKDYQIIQLAKDALTGQLIIPADPEPIAVHDLAWLLRFASVSAGVAADMVDAQSRG